MKSLLNSSPALMLYTHLKLFPGESIFSTFSKITYEIYYVLEMKRSQVRTLNILTILNTKSLVRCQSSSEIIREDVSS